MDAGATCRFSATAESKEELLQKVAEHLRKKHKVPQVTKTLQNYALRVTKER